MLAQKIGRNIIPVVEKYTELDLILKYAEKVGVRPQIGMRVKLASRGSGRWKSSGGYRSKFGLTVTEVLRGLGRAEEPRHGGLLQAAAFPPGQPDHQHPAIKGALNEAARVYVELASAGAGLRVPGRRRRAGHRLRRLADRFRIERQLHAAGIRQRRRLPHPERLRRSRRAASDHRFGERPRRGRLSQRAGVQRAGRLGHSAKREAPGTISPSDAEQPLIDLMETYQNLSTQELLESYHDAQQALDTALNLFSLGYLPLEQRSQAENLYWAICRSSRSSPAQMDYVPGRAAGPGRVMLSDTYFCNFSLFQACPTVGPSSSCSRSCRFTG